MEMFETLFSNRFMLKAEEGEKEVPEQAQAGKKEGQFKEKYTDYLDKLIQARTFVDNHKKLQMFTRSRHIEDMQ